MRVAAMWLVMGCGSSTITPLPPSSPATPAPSAQFVVEIGKTLQFYRVDGSMVTRTREIVLPSSISTLAWARHQPVLLLEDRVARVTEAGLEFLPLPPSHTWKREEPLDGGAVREDPPLVRMFTKDDEIWLSKCEWWLEGVYSLCAYWVDVRIDPAPVITVNEESHTLVEEVRVDTPATPATPSPSIHATLVPDQERHEGEREKLRCTDGSVTVEDPEVGTSLEQQFDNVTLGGRSDLVWLSTEPPIFQLTDWDNCRPCPRAVIFERCQRSTRYGSATFGPDGLILFRRSTVQRSQRVIVFRNGRELATIDHVSELGFVP